MGQATRREGISAQGLTSIGATSEEATTTTQEEGVSTTSCRMEDIIARGRALRDPAPEGSPRHASLVASLGTSPPSAPTRRLQLHRQSADPKRRTSSVCKPWKVYPYEEGKATNASATAIEEFLSWIASALTLFDAGATHFFCFLISSKTGSQLLISGTRFL
jgi:hypothetical protein